MFQSTHPHGVRLFSVFYLSHHRCFNPRTHTGCDPLRSFTCKAASGFNPRTHTGCDYPLMFSSNIKNHLFQSTHPHGVRHPKEGDGDLITSFNPRTHTGCDISFNPSIFFFQVSIHAPTRGATIRRYLAVPSPVFQSTHPHGVRL